MPAAQSPIYVELDALDFRRLVAGRAIVRGIAGHRVEIRQQGMSARAMIAAVLKVMGNDPIEAEEFTRQKDKP
jgi:hypothetical protein